MDTFLQIEGTAPKDLEKVSFIVDNRPDCMGIDQIESRRKVDCFTMLTIDPHPRGSSFEGTTRLHIYPLRYLI